MRHVVMMGVIKFAVRTHSFSSNIIIYKNNLKVNILNSQILVI